jgi:hypothetical protein
MRIMYRSMWWVCPALLGTRNIRDMCTDVEVENRARRSRSKIVPMTECARRSTSKMCMEVYVENVHGDLCRKCTDVENEHGGLCRKCALEHVHGGRCRKCAWRSMSKMCMEVYVENAPMSKMCTEVYVKNVHGGLCRKYAWRSMSKMHRCRKCARRSMSKMCTRRCARRSMSKMCTEVYVEHFGDVENLHDVEHLQSRRCRKSPESKMLKISRVEDVEHLQSLFGCQKSPESKMSKISRVRSDVENLQSLFGCHRLGRRADSYIICIEFNLIGYLIKFRFVSVNMLILCTMV